jgi:hypothetical protein
MLSLTPGMDFDPLLPVEKGGKEDGCGESAMLAVALSFALDGWVNTEASCIRLRRATVAGLLTSAAG